jgi:hypothetical protein
MSFRFSPPKFLGSWYRSIPRVSSVSLILVVVAKSFFAISLHAQSEEGASAVLFAQPVLSGEGEGQIGGQVFDRGQRTALSGVMIALSGTDLRATTDDTGRFSLIGVPAGRYNVVYSREGYLDATVIGVEIGPDKAPVLDFAMVMKSGNPQEDVVMLDSLSVTPEKLTQQMKSFEVRLQAEKIVNVFSLEDFGKFSAGDVADALVRISGVNVVKGQFAIIRGLEDRYSSVLYNSAPIPSPDPDSQSVQLDLFPSDVVSSLMVAKTFAGDLPGNSSGGSINIFTTDYSEEGGSWTGSLTIKFSAGTGFNANARDRFIDFTPGSPIGSENGSESDVIESDFGLTLSGRKAFGKDRLVFKIFAGQEIDYDTLTGWQETREPRTSFVPTRPRPGQTARSGDLALGRLTLSGGRYELTDSTRTEQTTGYLGLGYHFRKEGSHKLDASVFFTRKNEDSVQLKENGYLPNLNYASIAPAPGAEFTPGVLTGFATFSSQLYAGRQSAGDGPSRGPLWFTNFNQSRSLEQERDLLVFQLNGDHHFGGIKNLHVTWAANRATTSQDETAFGVDYFYEPTNGEQIPVVFPTTAASLGPGVFAANNDITYSMNAIEERQNFGRLDVDYEWAFTPEIAAKFLGGIHLEKASRDVTSSFLLSPTVGGLSQFAITGRTPEELGQNIPLALGEVGLDGRLNGSLSTTSEAERLIKAFHFGTKLSFWRKLDLLASFRRENVFIESRNDPFLKGEPPMADGSPKIFPSKYLFFDRQDNAASSELPSPPGTVFNDQLLGIEVPVDPVTGFVDIRSREALEALLNRSIDEKQFLPSFGLTFWATSQLSIRAGYSETVARPSFREIGYYVSVQPGSSDLVVGNPQLKLSEVESMDLRVEYFWGNQGDLIAASVFKKKIDRPIESIVIRDQGDFESSTQYRTFFNNPNEATLEGLELEARKTLDFIGLDFAKYFSLGGNYTLIEAEVARSQAELNRGPQFFVAVPGEDRFTGLNPTRRLYGQPEWIANADLNFNHTEWGTKATIAFFAISDVLDAAGSSVLGRDRLPYAFALDRYLASYNRIDFSFSQAWRNWTFKLSAKNLTDSERKVIYDPDQLTEEVPERSYKMGQDYSVSASYSF